MSNVLEILKEAVRILGGRKGKSEKTVSVADLKLERFFPKAEGSLSSESGIWENKNLFEWISRRRYAV